MRIKGIDISRAQEMFDFDAAERAGVKFVIIRAGIRTDEDTYLRHNIKECQSRSLPYGLYWYFEATTSERFEAELAACKKSVSGLKPQYPVFFDMEEQAQITRLNNKTRTDMAIRFCAEMTKIGVPSGIYTNPAWMESYYDKSRIVGKYDIWLAHWTEDPNQLSSYNYGQTMWQWGVDYIGGRNVDGDICFIDYPAKTAKWYVDNGIDKAVTGDTESVQTPTSTTQVEVNLSDVSPYVVTTDRSSRSLDFNKLKKLGVIGIMLEAGYVYSPLHVHQKRFQNPNLADQTQAASDADMPFGLYMIARARTVEEAKIEMNELNLTLFKYPPKLGVWLQLNLSKYKHTNTAILEYYYNSLVDQGFYGQVGLLATRDQLNQIDWTSICNKWYLWLSEPMSDVRNLKDNIRPELFII